MSAPPYPFVPPTDAQAAGATGVYTYENGAAVARASITAALAAIPGGGVVLIYPGTYAEATLTVPDGVRIFGIGPAQDIRITGNDTASTRVVFEGTGGLRNILVIGPSEGANPTIDATAIGAADQVVLYTVVFIGGGSTTLDTGSTGAAILAGADGTVACIDLYHNGGRFAGDFAKGTGATLVIEGGFANVGEVAGSYWYADGGTLDFTASWTMRAMVGEALAAVRLGDNATLSGTYALETGNVASRGLWIDGDGVTVTLSGASLLAATNDLYIGAGLVGTDSALNLAGCLFRLETISNNAGASWYTTAANLWQYADPAGADDPAIRFLGEASFGSPSVPVEISVGEGDSSTAGLVARRDDGTGTAFVDIGAELRSSSGSTAALFPTGVNGDVFYIGNTDRKFPAFKPTITTAQVWGSGTAVWEYSTGEGTWSSFPVMYRDDSGTGTSYGQAVFTVLSATRATKIAFCSIAAASSDWVSATVDGTAAYWLRMRLTADIDTVPVLERIKLSTNSAEIDNTGIQYHGTSRPTRAIPGLNLGLSYPLSGANPGNETISISANIALTPTRNQFNNAQDDGLGGTFRVLPGLDTSAPITVRVGWYPSSNGSGEAKLKFYHADGIDVGTQIDAGTVPEGTLITTWDTRRPTADQTDAVPSVEANTQGKLYISESTFTIEDALPGTVVAYALRRNDSSDADAFTGNVVIAYLEGEGRFWR